MNRSLTDYEIFEASSVANRRLLRQEELILEVTIILCEAMEREGVSKAELANKLSKTKGFVSQILAGGRNLTLRTIADVADALGYKISIQALRKEESKESESPFVDAQYVPEPECWELDQLREETFTSKPSSAPVLTGAGLPMAA